MGMLLMKVNFIEYASRAIARRFGLIYNSSKDREQCNQKAGSACYGEMRFA